MSFTAMREQDDVNGFISEFQRYIRGEMTKKEENAFQRKLRTDLYAEGVIEGFSDDLPWVANGNLDHSGKKFKKSFKPGKRVYYIVAATVAVLIIVSSVFLILERNKSGWQLRDILKPGPAELNDYNEIPVSPGAGSMGDLDTLEINAGNGITKVIIDTTTSGGTGNTSISENAEVPATPVEKDSGSYNASPAYDGSMNQKMSSLNIRGKIISSANRMPIAGVKVIVKGTNTGAVTDTGGNFKLTLPDETNHTLVTELTGMEPKEFQAISGSEMQIELKPQVKAPGEDAAGGTGLAGTGKSESQGYISSQPVDSYASFRRYIEENMKRPEVQPQGSEAVVVVSFIVRSTGAIDSIKVISSPGEEFTSEATRLIREGPAWKPAEENGQAIDDEVSLRIVFK